MDMIKIGKFLCELRKEQNLTQEQLGEELGVSNKTISRWEPGTYLPPVEMLQLLSDKY
ncbi:MAG: helix-turn-helix transcriptional regulator, partial [Clostridia bacterium]|nr:helix-turn-helix transcriptional regulator [Clostridia bacterium]